jgi:ubiquinone/menaquinone biosynthesis C-methylase UbiE
MELNQAIALIQIKDVFNNEKKVWVDLGCGAGLFTNALAHLLKEGSKIFAVDKNINAFKNFYQRDKITIEKIKADFINDELNIEKADGIMMANSLHFVKGKLSFIKKMEKHFKTVGCFLIVEYNTDTANTWVPYPLSFYSMKTLFEKAGYSSISKINEVDSRFNRAKIYSAFIGK